MTDRPITMQTWVLILIPYNKDEWPAVIGGYPSEDQACAAGYNATSESRRVYPTGGIYNTPTNGWRSFRVIPGAASTSPTE